MGKKLGSIKVVGVPYDNDFMTQSLIQVIRSADVLIGHESFIEQVKQFITAEAQTFDILDQAETQKDFRDLRIQAAIEQAELGKHVVMLSSGDPGIWGMAAYLFPELVKRGYKREDGIDVEVLPGITAAQVAASKLGAPLMNGFAFNALCDDLTKPEVNDRRFKACAEGDFVTVVYKLRYNAEFNPDFYPIEQYPQFYPPVQRAKERLQQMVDIFSPERLPETPVVIASNLGEETERLLVVPLKDLIDHFEQIDECTILIIGNSETRFEDQWLVALR
ncbi:MAG TPA: precorrin-3B C(17)-methyltransferase [Bacilli bacterium]|nr:precorrin-3B C(17)-methyltransferase [Bacilli bacterium]